MNALVMVLVLGASDVSLRVEAGTPCLEQRRLASLLVAQGLVVRAGAPLEVLARGTGSSLSLVGTRGAEHFSRTVPAGVGECAAVERIVVSLINSWAQPLSLALRSESKVDAGVGVRAGVEAALVVDAGRLAARVVDARVLVPDAGVEITTIDAGEFAVTSPETVEPPPVFVEPEIVVVEVVDAGVPLELDGGVVAASPLSLTLSPAGGRGEAVVDVSVLGGGAIGPTETVAGTGSVRVGFSVGRFGAVLDANLETERTKNIADGTAFTTRQWLGLSARAEFRPLETLLLDVTLGVRGTRVVVGGRDYPDAHTSELFDFGGTLTGGARVLLFGPVWLEGRGMAGLRTRVTALVLEEPETKASTQLLVVQPWDIGLSLGLCARF